MRIVVAGFQHETNTFVARPTALAEFERADSWPELLTGAAVLAQTQGMNLPIAGFAQAATEAGATLLPLLWCSAEPSGRVTQTAFETLSGRILDGLKAAAPFDALYLDLHGAMVTERHDDGEGRLLTRLRQKIGPEIPLVASLDLHANISPAMVEAADALLVFRTYPHLDMAHTGERAFHMLRAIHRNGPPAKAFRQGDYLIPLHAQHTGVDPARSLYARCDAWSARQGETVELALGFTASDTRHARPAIVAYASTQAAAERCADALAEALSASEAAFDCTLLAPADAVEQAMAECHLGPVVLADVQDNPGAGGSSDTTGLLRAVLARRTPNTLLGLIHDPDLAQQAHAAGRDQVFAGRIGGRGPGDAPVEAQVRVLHLSDGHCTYSGQMYGGGIATLGPSAALRIEDTDVSVVVTSIPNQCLDQAHFRHFGLDPAAAALVCVKSTAHFRADFEGLAHRIIPVAAPGQFPCVLSETAFQNLAPGLRLGPCGPPFDPSRSD